MKRVGFQESFRIPPVGEIPLIPQANTFDPVPCGARLEAAPPKSRAPARLSRAGCPRPQGRPNAVRHFRDNAPSSDHQSSDQLGNRTSDHRMAAATKRGPPHSPRFAPQASTRFYTLYTAYYPRSVSGGIGTNRRFYNGSMSGMSMLRLAGLKLTPTSVTGRGSPFHLSAYPRSRICLMAALAERRYLNSKT